MSRQLQHVSRRHLGTSAVALPLYLLSACGGDGAASIESIPPAPSTVAPTPAPTATPSPMPASATTPTTAPAKDTYPISRAGTYDLIGTLTVDPGTGIPGDWIHLKVVPGEFTMTIGNASDGGLTYSLHAPAGILPGGRTSVDSGHWAGWSINSNGYTRGGSLEAPPFGAGTNLGIGLFVDPGSSYVSMGEWEWPVILTDNRSNATNFGVLLFVSGDRTPASGIPASGTASYDAHSLVMQSNSGAQGIPFRLTADFGQRTMATRIEQDFRNNGGPGSDPSDFSPIQGIHVAGSAPFANDGLFNIRLSGTINFAYEYVSSPPPSQTAFGEMNGAFFGPHAEQVGGTFSIQRTNDQLPLYQDAFVGQQHQ